MICVPLLVTVSQISLRSFECHEGHSPGGPSIKVQAKKESVCPETYVSRFGVANLTFPLHGSSHPAGTYAIDVEERTKAPTLTLSTTASIGQNVFVIAAKGISNHKGTYEAIQSSLAPFLLYG